MHPELIIFDCDGVLVESELITNQVFAGMLAGIGLPLGVDYLFEHFVGRSMQHCWQEIGKMLAPFRNRMFSATDVPNGKPAPDIFLYAAAKCGVEPGRCTVIEDSSAGVRAGAAAGMRVYGYSAQTSARQLLLAGAHGTFTDMRRLPELLFGQNVAAMRKKRLD
jgi:beta-phosphoglucomutase-like phosphatase (HAD superfamily)